MDQHTEALMAEAAYAPFAGFVVVAGADGDVEEKEVRAFLASLSRLDDPLLVEMIRAAPEPLEHRVDVLIGSPERIPASLSAAGQLFARHPDGDVSRAAFMAILRDVAEAHGELRATERDTMQRVEQLLDLASGRAPLQAGIAAQGGMALFGAVVVWQVASATLGWTAWFVPVAVVLQAIVLAMLLFLGQALGHRYWQQVAAGVIASVVGGVLIAISSVVVTTWLVPGAGSALEGAVAGFVGTVLTGVVLSLILAVFLRR